MQLRIHLQVIAIVGFFMREKEDGMGGPGLLGFLFCRDAPLLLEETALSVSLCVGCCTDMHWSFLVQSCSAETCVHLVLLAPLALVSGMCSAAPALKQFLRVVGQQQVRRASSLILPTHVQGSNYSGLRVLEWAWLPCGTALLSPRGTAMD